MNKRQLRDIVKADNARRAKREAAYDVLLGIADNRNDPLSDASKIAENTVRGSYVNPCLVRGIGTVNPPMPTSASRNSWDRGMRGRVVGVATGTEDTSDGTPTVLVTYADGTSEVRAISSFKGHRSSSTPKQIKRTNTTPEVAALPSIRRGEDY